LTTQFEKSPAPASPGPSSAAVVALIGLLGIAAVVFLVLPRWSAPPVVTTAQQPSPPARVSSAAPPSLAAPAPPVTSGAIPDPDTTPLALPDPEPAIEGRVRVVDSRPREETLREPASPDPPSPPSGFDAAVSEGLAALDRGAPAEARAAFTRAEALRPGTAVVKDGLARSEAGLRAEALEGHRKRAQAAEAAEDWRTALREYEGALRIEPAVRFAVEGALRASQRADASDRLDAYIRRPDRLSTDEVAREAEIALDRASEIPSPGPRLRRQIGELRAHLAAAGAAVIVRLLSDERTDVSVLRVGPVGRFREKTLELRPGSYVVVGTRRGYRDTRRTLVVPPGRSPEPLTVRCDEVL
jgi:hypothetical protein